MSRPASVVPQLEVLLTRNMETGVGYSLAVYGSLLGGESVNAEVDGASGLRRALAGVVDRVVETVEQGTAV